MDIDTQNDPFRHTKVLAEHTKALHLSILLINEIFVSEACASFNTESAYTDSIKQSVREIRRYRHIIRGIPCQIIDISHLYATLHNTILDQAHIEEIRARINKVHCIWFATRLDETGVSVDEQNAIKWLSTLLGEQAWNSALLILTQENTIKKLSKCATMMKKKSEKIRANISHYTGWDLASSITSVLVTRLDEIMRYEQNLLPEIYTQILHTVYQREIAQHSLTIAIDKDISSSKKVLRESSSQWQEVARDKKENKRTKAFPYHINTLARCYAWSAPAGMIGMCLWGPEGFGIALLCNAVFWIVVRWLQARQES